MTQGARAVGGKLAVAGGRIGFGPHGLDRATGGLPFEAALTDIVEIDLAPRTYNPFDGGLRKRLRLRLSDGQEAMFVVSGPQQVGERVAESVRGAGGSLTSDPRGPQQT